MPLAYAHLQLNQEQARALLQLLRWYMQATESDPEELTVGELARHVAEELIGPTYYELAWGDWLGVEPDWRRPPRKAR